MYSAKLLDYFGHPRNAGDVENATASVELSNPVCGDVVRFSARVLAGKIEEIRFRAKGCVPAMACASALTELARGCDVADLQSLSSEEVEAAVDGVPEASRHASQMVVEGLRKLLGEIEAKSTRL
jgi:NifU-like protein involved in Fe-S cluster formation